MGNYYQRKNNLYIPGSGDSFRISRSKIDLFLGCPKCFYLDRRLGIPRPEGPGFPLNSAVDSLLKNEFDLLRQKGEAHELMKIYKIDAVPFNHEDFPVWRDDFHRFTGASVLHGKTNLEIGGIIDDIWVNKDKELSIVDYKATSTSREISLDDEYKQGYKKQMEVYQWIFRKMGFPVSNMGYFVFANAGKNRPDFDGRLEFALSILSYEGSDGWVEPTIFKIKECLESDKIPEAGANCDYCKYTALISKQI